MVGTPTSMFRWTACTVSLVCIAASTTLAQVTIREKVELTGNVVSKGFSVRFPPNVTAIRVEVANHDYGDGLTYITLPGDKETANYHVSGGTFSANLVSHQYWGIATLIATIIGPVSSGLVGLADTVQFPVDVDADGMSDVWERAHGFLSMTSSSDNCGLPGVVCQDSAWDGDALPATDFPGDGFSKIEEYQGVTIGGVHQRLGPDIKELFVDAHLLSPAQATLVLGKLDSLGFDAYEVVGIDDIDAFFDGVEIFPGEPSLDWLRPNIEKPAQGYIRMSFEDRGFIAQPATDAEEWLNGLLIREGVFYWEDIPWNSPVCPSNDCFKYVTALQHVVLYQKEAVAPILGKTWRSDAFCGYSESIVFRGTIGSFFDVNVNSIAENADIDFQFQVSKKPSDPRMVARFPADFTMDGDSLDLVNPYDGADYDGFDPADQFSLKLTESATEARVLLHELGHALGIKGEETTLPSPMYNIVGPNLTTNYSSDDVRAMNLVRCPEN